MQQAAQDGNAPHPFAPMKIIRMAASIRAAYGVDVTSPALWPQLAKLLTEQILRRDASAYLSAYHEIAHLGPYHDLDVDTASYCFCWG
jgi:hypothetical protein